MLARRDRPGLGGRAGDRPLGQLVQPGAVRPADEAAVGPRDRARATSAELPRLADLPTDVPVRVALVSARRSGTIVWLERNRGLRRGQAFALYVSMYTFGRIWFEALRVDPASEIFGIRFNLLLSVVLCVAGAIWFVWLGAAQSASPASSQPHATSDSYCRSRRRSCSDHHVSAHHDRRRTRRAGDQDLRPGRHRGARARRCRRRVRARALHRDHGPVRLGQVDVAALHRRPRPAHERRGVPRRRRARAALREAAHEGPPRQDRVRLPGVQPDPDAHRAREHHAADGARGPRPRQGVARPRDRHGRPPRPADAPAVGALRRPAATRRRRPRARERARRSSSPTSRPATSTRRPAPRSSQFMRRRSPSSARRS